MAETIAIRVSARTLRALQRGQSVPIRLNRSNVVGGVARRPGRKPGKNAPRSLWWNTGGLPSPGSLPARLLLWAIRHGGKVNTKQAIRALRRSRMHASGELSKLTCAELLRRESRGFYVVTAKGKAARAALSEVTRYRKGSQRARVLDWARKHRRPFGIADVAKLLGVGHGSVHVALGKLLRDRVLRRKSLGVYRAV